jgi:hypothetical protein
MAGAGVLFGLLVLFNYAFQRPNARETAAADSTASAATDLEARGDADESSRQGEPLGDDVAESPERSIRGKYRLEIFNATLNVVDPSIRNRACGRQVADGKQRATRRMGVEWRSDRRGHDGLRAPSL